MHMCVYIYICTHIVQQDMVHGMCVPRHVVRDPYICVCIFWYIYIHMHSAALQGL